MRPPLGTQYAFCFGEANGEVIARSITISLFATYSILHAGQPRAILASMVLCSQVCCVANFEQSLDIWNNI